MSPTCHQRTSTWCTDRIYIIVVEDNSTIGKRIDIRCWYLIGAMKANIIPALEIIQGSSLIIRIEFDVNVNKSLYTFPYYNSFMPYQVICDNNYYVWTS